ncbi:MOSC domain-containing protein [Roseobacteraceae bacterium S113]
MADLIARVAQPGELIWIGLRPARRQGMVAVEMAQIGLDGLKGDHGRPGKRAVTLLQQEHLAVIGSFLGRPAVLPDDLRRNLVVSGINLAGLRGREIAVGATVLRITGPCAPCSRMEEAFGHGGYAAVRGHGGMTAEVVTPGHVRLADAVRALD